MSINALGGQSQDQSVTVTADGNVKASNGAIGNNVSGVEIVTSQENDAGEAAPEAPSGTHTMTTKVTAGSMTVEGGPESTAVRLYVNAGSDNAVQDITVDVKDDIKVSGQEGQTVTGINLSQGGANDNSVNISVGGSVVVDGKGYSSDGVRISNIMSTNGEASVKIDIKENLTVKRDGEESFLKGVDRVESEMAGNLDILVGGNVTTQPVSEATMTKPMKMHCAQLLPLPVPRLQSSRNAPAMRSVLYFPSAKATRTLLTVTPSPITPWRKKQRLTRAGSVWQSCRGKHPSPHR